MIKLIPAVAALLLLLAAGALADPTPTPNATTPTAATKEVTPAAGTGTGLVTATQPAASEPTLPPQVPKNLTEVIDKAKEAVDLGKAKKWFALSAAVIWLVVFLLKLGRDKLAFLKNLHRRWFYIIVGLLSVAAMLLAKFEDDLSWGAAVLVLFSGPGAAFLNDLLKRGILGQEPTPDGGVKG